MHLPKRTRESISFLLLSILGGTFTFVETSTNMKQLVLLPTLLATLSTFYVELVSSFSPCDSNDIIINQRHSASSSTALFGTIEFAGNANASYDTPSLVIQASQGNNEDGDKSLPKFLTTPASDSVLLGTETSTRIEDDGTNGELWECRQASIGWFGMTLSPIFINRIERNPSSDNVVVSIIDARTEVTKGGRFGNTLASAMQRSKFEGRNAISWNVIDGDTSSYTLEGSLKLTLTINLPPFLPLPPGFNTIGGKIVQRVCKERLKQNLREISDAYMVWTTQKQSTTVTGVEEDLLLKEENDDDDEKNDISDVGEDDGGEDGGIEDNSSKNPRIRKRDILKRKLGL